MVLKCHLSSMKISAYIFYSVDQITSSLSLHMILYSHLKVLKEYSCYNGWDYSQSSLQVNDMSLSSVPHIPGRLHPQSMAVVKVSSAFGLTLLLMALLLAPSRAGEACDQWLSDTYRMLFLCSTKICNEHCIGEGGTRGECGFLIARSFCFCTKECN
ncbi:hypothetical protein U9M48_037422 [Paspalum notatum var. saurae]|uniref:Knottin scorpion toxin-like domain-containing protein n=1 Tax=Paspalum notatum var. saurae TaxID=547442 RepID=A0AAQ3UGE0_PASNO